MQARRAAPRRVGLGLCGREDGVQLARTATVRRDTAIGAGTVVEDGATVRRRSRYALVTVLAIRHARCCDRGRADACTSYSLWRLFLQTGYLCCVPPRNRLCWPLVWREGGSRCLAGAQRVPRSGPGLLCAAQGATWAARCSTLGAAGQRIEAAAGGARADVTPARARGAGGGVGGRAQLPHRARRAPARRLPAGRRVGGRERLGAGRAGGQRRARRRRRDRLAGRHAQLQRAPPGAVPGSLSARAPPAKWSLAESAAEVLTLEQRRPPSPSVPSVPRLGRGRFDALRQPPAQLVAGAGGTQCWAGRQARRARSGRRAAPAQVAIAPEHQVLPHARVSLCRQAQQAGSLSDDELEYAAASSPAQGGRGGRGGGGLGGGGVEAAAGGADERPSHAVLGAARAAAAGQPCAALRCAYTSACGHRRQMP